LILILFNTGFEGIGRIVAKGSKVSNLKLNDSVAIAGNGCFSEYIIIHHKKVLAIPSLSPEIIPILVGGLTASLALEHVGQMQKGETVLVTGK
jgi:NADPH:quinone reductase-like Zn-dependent oxidoreductase